MIGEIAQKDVPGLIGIRHFHYSFISSEVRINGKVGNAQDGVFFVDINVLASSVSLRLVHSIPTRDLYLVRSHGVVHHQHQLVFHLDHIVVIKDAAVHYVDHYFRSVQYFVGVRGGIGLEAKDDSWAFITSLQLGYKASAQRPARCVSGDHASFLSFRVPRHLPSPQGPKEK